MYGEGDRRRIGRMLMLLVFTELARPI